VRNQRSGTPPAVSRLVLLGLVVLAAALAGCSDTKPKLRAISITDRNQLIGGPCAKGKLGDFLIENDKIRVVIANAGPTFSAGLFGGTMIDIDRHRWRSADRASHGWDAFQEAFPLANLLTFNPSSPNWQVEFTDEGMKLGDTTLTVDAVRIIEDGSQGRALIRVEGHAAYLFDVLKYLNRDFLEGFLGDGLAGLSFEQIVKMAKSLVGTDLLSLLNRLQIGFDFSTDYILEEGQDYLTLRTTVILSPPSTRGMAPCPKTPCDEKCEYGYQLREAPLAIEGFKDPMPVRCPICACADHEPDMPTFNESRDFFSVLLGRLEDWANPLWKGGVVAGDFLFYGGNCEIFLPGMGFDYDAKIFSNMWQGVGTMGSPFGLDFVTGLSDNVSYTWVTKNPKTRTGFDCPSYRLVVRYVAPDQEDALVEALVDEFGFSEAVAKGKARIAVVDHTPIELGISYPSAPHDPGTDAGTQARAEAFDAWLAQTLSDDEVTAVQALLGDDITIGLEPQHDCKASKLLVPLFTSSATAVLTHFSEGDALVADGEDAYLDKTRAYTFERYVVVGDGDVGSTLDATYALRGTPHGRIRGVVLEDGSGMPIHHADVFLLRDLRVDRDAEPVPGSFREYEAKANAALGTPGFASHMQTDVGQDPVHDGDFSGPIESGAYLIAAHHPDRGTSALVPVVVTEGSEIVVHLTLPAPGRVAYHVSDASGQAVPARLTFFVLDADGMHYDWHASNEPTMGDSRYDHGIVKLELSAHGDGVVSLPPGRYDVLVSRGLEYGTDVFEDIEVRSGQEVPLNARLVHEVDTRGFVSADFHIHQSPSSDAGLAIDTRLKAAAAEGLEFMTSSDHDHLLDYDPYIKELGLERFLKAQVGVETSPLEYGHYNGFPMKYDDRDGTIHDPPPWPGRTLGEFFDEMIARAAGSREDFVLEANHVRDGTLGMFSQIGMKGYSLERATPGMQMCSPIFESVPCEPVDAVEIINGKHVEYLWTPTIGEIRNHNVCLREIVASRDQTEFALSSPSQPDGVVCGWLQAAPSADCEGAATAASEGDLSDEELGRRVRLRDHCVWHQQLADEFAQCGEDGVTLIECKRYALEGLKQLSARYMLERTQLELDAYTNTTAETDIGCDFEKAFEGCEVQLDDQDAPKLGCGEAQSDPADDCFCRACVCDQYPDCCVDVADGGAGWDETCVAACASECYGCGIQPCTDRFQTLDDWFALLNVGYDLAGVANSDSHTLTNQVGLPRTYVKSPTDRPANIEARDVNRGLKAFHTTMSLGPFIELEIVADGDVLAGLGDRVSAKGVKKLQAHVRVQTPSWFKVDRLELYRNGLQERVFYLEGAKEDVVDFDQLIDLVVPAEDSWYVAMVYGLNDRDQMTPVYKRRPYGHILFTTVIALAADSLLASYSELLDKVTPLLGDVSALLGSIELPDSFPVMPWASTNPIWIDVDGDGFWPVNARDEDGDGEPDLPPYCSKPCVPAPDEDGKDTQSDCGLNQTCVTDPITGEGECRIPIPEHCIGMQPVVGAGDLETASMGLSAPSPSSLVNWQVRPPKGVLGRFLDPHWWR
jgi:hypothetical protein